MNISAKELAEKLNLSAATVSMVLNNKPGISQATRELVLEAAKSYGYTETKNPDEKIRRDVIHFIIYKKHGTVVADTPFFSQVIEGINQQCLAEKCELQISYFYEYGDVEKQLQELQEKLDKPSVETSSPLPSCNASFSGILLLGTELEPQNVKPFQEFGVPVVVLDCYDDRFDMDCVLINNVQGAFRATSHLIEMGHSKVGYLKSSVEISNFRERADGYYKALRTHGISTSHPYVHAFTPTVEEGYSEFCAILEQKPDLATAYFADNDIVAAAAIRAFRQYGYRIPEDISVIGFDNMPFCQLIDPPLSTMDVQKEALGAQAVIQLAARMRSGQHGTHNASHSGAPVSEDTSSIKIEISTTLIERGSVQKL